MEEKLTFGKYVLQKRKEAGLSQKQPAEALFITESAVGKWESGVSYPDISLVAPICKVLGISEHELITATDDRGQRELERQARSFQTVVKTYSRVFYILYGVSLAACFICNPAVHHTLSWFFIVPAAELVAFSLTNVPACFKAERAGDAGKLLSITESSASGLLHRCERSMVPPRFCLSFIFIHGSVSALCHSGNRTASGIGKA